MPMISPRECRTLVDVVVARSRFDVELGAGAGRARRRGARRGVGLDDDRGHDPRDGGGAQRRHRRAGVNFGRSGS
jgi:hypothetical protein